eukprot:PhF_6_TR27931/c0_g1_i1/m.41118
MHYLSTKKCYPGFIHHRRHRVGCLFAHFKAMEGRSGSVFEHHESHYSAHANPFVNHCEGILSVALLHDVLEQCARRGEHLTRIFGLFGTRKLLRRQQFYGCAGVHRNFIDWFDYIGFHLGCFGHQEIC